MFLALTHLIKPFAKSEDTANVFVTNLVAGSNSRTINCKERSDAWINGTPFFPSVFGCLVFTARYIGWNAKVEPSKTIHDKSTIVGD